MNTENTPSGRSLHMLSPRAAVHRPSPLGVSTFGESGDVNSLYRKHAIDAEAILDMAALACLDASR